jgi:hypothetical protein
MTPGQQQALYRALLAAFSSEGDFEKVVFFAFGQSLDRVAGPGSLDDRIFETVRWAVERGQGDRLLAAVRDERPDSPEIAAVVAELEAVRSTPSALADTRPAGGTREPRETGRGLLAISTPEQLMQLMNFVVVWMFCALPVLVVLYLIAADRAPWWAALATLVVVVPCGTTFSRAATGGTRALGWPQ